MFLSSFSSINFRNIESIQLDFDKNCNIFYGKNGSGKTSILESIYYLSLGRSFRSHLLRRIIKYDADGFSIFGKIRKTDITIPVGISRSIANGKHIRISGENIHSNIELAKLLPLQLLNQDCYRLFDEGPKPRRQFIDWGLFYIESSFLDLWRKTERIINQRNAAIRINSNIDSIKMWDKELSQLGFELHLCRKKYIENFIPIAQSIIQKLLNNLIINITYYAGWNTALNLENILYDNLKNDLRLGYTTTGPQRADLMLTVGKIPAKDALSRGQQKLLLYGLQIARGSLLYMLTGKNCIYLVDDFPAELDLQKRILLANILSELKSQLFVTGLVRDDVKNIFTSKKGKMFHVEHGMVTSQFD